MSDSEPSDDVVVFRDCGPVDTRHSLDDPRCYGMTWINGVLQRCEVCNAPATCSLTEGAGSRGAHWPEDAGKEITYRLGSIPRVHYYCEAHKP